MTGGFGRLEYRPDALTTCVDRHQADAGAGGEPLLLPAESHCLDRFADIVRDAVCGLERTLLDEDDKLVSAGPADGVLPPDLLLEDPRYPPKQLVARAIAAGLVDDL